MDRGSWRGAKLAIMLPNPNPLLLDLLPLCSATTVTIRLSLRTLCVPLETMVQWQVALKYPIRYTHSFGQSGICFRARRRSFETRLLPLLEHYQGSIGARAAQLKIAPEPNMCWVTRGRIVPAPHVPFSGTTHQPATVTPTA